MTSVALPIVIFLVCLALPFAWMMLRLRVRRLPVTVTVDPEDPRPAQIADCFCQIAQRLDERPERMEVAVYAANALGRGVSLDFEPDGTLVVAVDGYRPKRFSLRRRWIPEHPVPLQLWSPRRPRRHCRIYVDPVDSNRFRVTECGEMRFPLPVGIACSLAAAFGAYFVIPELLAAAAGIAFGFVLTPFRFTSRLFLMPSCPRGSYAARSGCLRARKLRCPSASSPA